MNGKLRTAEEYLSGHSIDYESQKEGIGLMHPDELMPNLYRALKSNLFYVFIVPYTQRFIMFMKYIEDKYYEPGTIRNREYATVMRFTPTIPYVLAKKHLSRKDLYRVLEKGECLSGPITEKEFLTSGVDIIVLTDEPNQRAIAYEVQKFRDYYVEQEEHARNVKA